MTCRFSAEDRLAKLARLCVLHHTALAYPHQPGMLRFLNDHTRKPRAASLQERGRRCTCR